MIDSKDIKEIMNIFSKKGIVFQNEQQFQFELAREIEKKCKKNEKVLFEYVAYTEKDLEGIKKYYIDLIIVNNKGEYIPIELKYKTKDGIYFRDGVGIIILSDQGACDLGRYDYLFDVHRIENLKRKTKEYDYTNSEKLLKKYKKGFSIMITNEPKYWEVTKDSLEKTKHTNYSYYNYCIGDGDTVKKGQPLIWVGTHNNKSFNNRKAFKLINNYGFKWNDYCNGAGDNTDFKYLITEI